MTPTSSYADRDGFIWIDGEIVPWREANIHVLSHGLHYGGSVFEGERVYEGTIFKLREHSERLIKSGDHIGMTIPYSVEEIEEASKQIIKKNNIINGYVRPIAWRGSEQMAISAQNATIHVSISCWEWTKYFSPKNGEDAGIALRTSRWHRPNPNSSPVQSKSAGIYMIGTMAKHEADDAGFDDALMLDYKGRIAEATGANLFVVKDKKISTPIPESFLNGITRQTIIKLAKELGYIVEETTIMPDDMKNMDEVFVTGTAAEITAVGRIDDITYKTGPVTRHLQEAYSDLVRQIK